MAITPIIKNLTFDAFTEDLKKYEITISRSKEENLLIKAIYKNGLIIKEYTITYTLIKLKTIHIFKLFDSVDDCILFMSDTLKCNKLREINCKLKEEEDKGILIIPIELGRINEIEFELLGKEKTIKDSVDYALELINKIYNENIELKTEIENLKKDKENILSKLSKLEEEYENFTKIRNIPVDNLLENEPVDNLFNDSVIVTKNENRMIYNWINENNIKCKLLYRASTNGDSPTSFHSCCDGKGPTITFIKTDDGKRIGGFTKISWSSPSNNYNYKADPDSFIFSLDTCQKLEKVGNREFAVCHYSNRGPTFGGGHDIFIFSECRTNSKSYCYPGFTYKSISTMKPKWKNYFKVDDYEVYLIEI
ncbi:TLD-domain-containing protein [Neocallimastix lanati (nom. inval.)]|nr:TLD-domain-containing protein [Neocallimastix sp. JGI-2020a]